MPPEIIAGTGGKPLHNLHLVLENAENSPNGENLRFECKALCSETVKGHFLVKMRSKYQLNKMFGHEMAYTVKADCGSGIVSEEQVDVLINGNGLLELPRHQKSHRGPHHHGHPVR